MIVRQLRSIFSLAVSLLTIFLLTSCAQPAAPEVSEDNSANGDKAEMITELQIIDVVEGEGATASAGQMVVVHYTGWLYEPGADEDKGTKFDSSRDRGDPFTFPLGQGQVIQGWDQGFAGMQVGGKRTLIIPPHMGYGDQGAGAVIPPGATLLFDVELLDVQ
jgi:FKBP-type peptidyl-prolyl cis-trans isomerase